MLTIISQTNQWRGEYINIGCGIQGGFVLVKGDSISRLARLRQCNVLVRIGQVGAERPRAGKTCPSVSLRRSDMV